MPPIELPPSIADKVRDRKRDRLRMELSVEQGEWLSSLILVQLVGMDIDDPEFRAVYLLQRSIVDQLDKLAKQK